jgi:hypothetical protein
MKFTIETETENMINFLDITIMKERVGLTFDIYRKPTNTDCIIPHDSCHPTEHELAAVRYLTNIASTQSIKKKKKILSNIFYITINMKYQ